MPQLKNVIHDGFIFSTNKDWLQIGRIHEFLATKAYWSPGLPRAVLEKAITGSLCFGVYLERAERRQVGFARVVTDGATFGWICDVYIDEEYRGRGVAKGLMTFVRSHPELQGLRRLCLATRDAHGLYEGQGFEVTKTPENWMEIKNNDVYRNARPSQTSAVGAMLALALFVVTVVCAKPAVADGPVTTEAPLGAVASPMAFQMYRALAKGTGNLVFSPYSLAVALGLVRAGAAGSTREALTRALGFDTDVRADAEVERTFRAVRESVSVSMPSTEKQGAVFEEANALWADRRFTMKPEFLDSAATSFGARPETLDFAAADQAAAHINTWASEKTHGKIASIVRSRDVKGASLVLTNAVYFKGAWEEKFDPKLTKPGPFVPVSGARVSVPFMTRTEHLTYGETPTAQVVAIPYRGSFDLVLILPRVQMGLPQLELDTELAAFDTAGRLRDVQLVLPRFKLASSHDLTAILRALGAGELLERPDLSRLTAVPGVHVSKVLQKAMIDTNEAGTEAAAVTAVVMMKSAIRQKPEKPVEFRADHPFAFALRHRASGTILFLGRVGNPKSTP